jgi:hypothetical protein
MLGLAFLLQLLQLAHGRSEGTLQARALNGDAVKQGEFFGETALRASSQFEVAMCSK